MSDAGAPRLAPAASADLGAVVADKRPELIAGMFDAIAQRYDVLNHVLSGGADWYWRWRAVRGLRLRRTDVLLDLCTGTGDVLLEALRRTSVARVIGIDFAGEMLRLGRDKLRRARAGSRAFLLRGDAMHVPLASESADAITIAFGIRNVRTPGRTCEEMARLLRPGGRIAILEFSMPGHPWLRGPYRWYFRHVLPRIGRLVSRHTDAYTYLPTSVDAFFTPGQFTALLRAAGLSEVTATPLTFGVVHLYTARRSARPEGASGA